MEHAGWQAKAPGESACPTYLLTVSFFSKTAVRAIGYIRNMKITPVLLVQEIEKSLSFWVDRMGFTKTVEMPEGDKVGFVILVRDGAELMMQTLGSVQKDEPKLAPEELHTKGTTLFIEVDDFADTKKRLEGYPIVMEERVTFYGMREIGVSEPGGHSVIFAAREG